MQHMDTRGSRRWPLFLIAAPAAVSIWSGWVGLGQLAGFGIVHPLPGIASSFRLDTAITLPVGVEAYGAYALGAWLTMTTAGRARTFAKRSAIGSLLLGMLGQVAYHLLAASHATRAPWPIVVLVACMPVATLGFGAALTHLLRAEAAHGAVPSGESIAETAGQATEMPVPDAIAGTPEVPAMACGPVPETAPAEVPAVASQPAPEVPAAQAPASRPPRRSQPPADEADRADREAARREYRKSVKAGKPLSRRALGEKFGRSGTWGAARIAECQEGPQLAAAR